MDEFTFITKYLTPLAAPHNISFSFKDDCALLPKNEYVVTSDIIVEGTHFFSDDAPEAIAHKLLHVNISDLVSKASTPQFYNLNLTLTPKITEEWLARFCTKLHEIQKQYGFSLIGGDTTKGSALVLSASFFGTTERKTIPTTNQAEIGDDIFVSGTIGDSYLGLLSLKKEIGYLPEFEQKYLYPTARINLLEIIKKHAKAATDISDGLVRDLNKILNSSKVGAKLILPSNLFHKEALSQPLESLISAGDDYQIIITSNPQNRLEIEQNSDFKFIGKITEDAELSISTDKGIKLNIKNPGYTHIF
jgi:thiamine-monophosphate kinase